MLVIFESWTLEAIPVQVYQNERQRKSANIVQVRDMDCTEKANNFVSQVSLRTEVSLSVRKKEERLFRAAQTYLFQNNTITITK